MSYCAEYLTGLNDSLRESAKNGKRYRADVMARASLRIISLEPLILGRNYDICHDAPRLAGACAIVGFTNKVTWNGGEYPTGIVRVDTGSELEWYLGFRANPCHVDTAADFVGYPPGFVVPLPEQFAVNESRVASAEQFAMTA